MTAPYQLRVRALHLRLEGGAWAQAMVAGATKTPGTAPPNPDETIFDMLGVSADALRAKPDSIKAVFQSHPAKQPTAKLETAYDEVSLLWDAQNNIMLRRVTIEQHIDSPWAMQDKNMENVANKLATFFGYTPATVTLTIEKNKRTFLTAEDLKKCGGTYACQKQAQGSLTRYSYDYTYGRDWAHKEKIESGGRMLVRDDSKLGIGREEEIVGHRFVFDDAELTKQLKLYLTLAPDPTRKTELETMIETGKKEQRNGVTCMRGSDHCFSTQECLDVFKASVVDRKQGAIHNNSIEYTEVLEVSHAAVDPSLFQTRTGPSGETPIAGSENPAQIATHIPDINDVYARYRAALAAIPAAGENVRSTLYDEAGGGGGPAAPPPNPDDCKKWDLAGQQLLCKLFGMDRVKDFAATYSANAPELREDDRLIESMFAQGGKDAGFFTATFKAIGSTHWRFVIALERARRDRVSKLGKGSRGNNFKHNVKEGLGGACNRTLCFERDEDVENIVRTAFDRTSWKKLAVMARVGNTFEHTAGCYSLPGSIEIVVDSWRNTFSMASEWWKANEASTYKALTALCGSSLCGECACVYQTLRVVTAHPKETLKGAFGSLCPNDAANFESAFKTYGPAARKALKLP